MRVWAIVLLTALGSGCSWFGSGSEGFTFVPAEDVGRDPFTADVAEPVPVEFVEVTDELKTAADDAEQQVIADTPPPDGAGVDQPAVDPLQVAQARQEAGITTAGQRGLSVIAPASPVGVGLFGGSGVNACDVEGLKGFLAAEPGKAAEFARVHGIDPGEIDAYLDGLTAGFLLADTDVTNHRFTDGRAEPFLATLQAGTAVLVDTNGTPRVRCKCGNPLQPARGTGAEYVGLWRGDYGYFLIVPADGEYRVAYECCRVGGLRMRRSGDALVGFFRDSTGTGRAEFRVRADGTLDGRWHFGDQGESNEGWDLQEVSAEQPPRELSNRIEDAQFYAQIPTP